MGVETFDSVGQDWIVLQDGVLESRVLEYLSPCWVTSQLRLIAELDHELVGLVCGAGDVTFGIRVELFDRVGQDWVVLQDGALEGRIFEDWSPCWIGGELGLVAESDLELVGFVCCTVDSVAFVYLVRDVSDGNWEGRFGIYRVHGQEH